MKNPHSTALITGASRGIGLAIAKAFAENGYNLVLTCSKSFQVLQENAVKLAETYNISCLPLQADMDAFADVKKYINRFLHWTCL